MENPWMCILYSYDKSNYKCVRQRNKLHNLVKKNAVFSFICKNAFLFQAGSTEILIEDEIMLQSQLI